MVGLVGFSITNGPTQPQKNTQHTNATNQHTNATNQHTNAKNHQNTTNNQNPVGVDGDALAKKDEISPDWRGSR